MNIVYLGHVIACLAGTVSTTPRRSLLFVCCAYCPHVACEAVVVVLCHQTVTRLDLLSDALRVQMCLVDCVYIFVLVWYFFRFFRIICAAVVFMVSPEKRRVCY